LSAGTQAGNGLEEAKRTRRDPGRRRLKAPPGVFRCRAPFNPPRDITITTGQVDASSTPTLMRLLASGQLWAGPSSRWADPDAPTGQGRPASPAAADVCFVTIRGQKPAAPHCRTACVRWGTPGNFVSAMCRNCNFRQTASTGVKWGRVGTSVVQRRARKWPAAGDTTPALTGNDVILAAQPWLQVTFALYLAYRDWLLQTNWTANARGRPWRRSRFLTGPSYFPDSHVR
jgi:hypothetical protein